MGDQLRDAAEKKLRKEFDVTWTIPSNAEWDEIAQWWRKKAISLQAEKDALEGALREIVNPIAAMRAEAEAQGAKLNGAMAVILADDASYLRGIAEAALKGDKKL